MTLWDAINNWSVTRSPVSKQASGESKLIIPDDRTELHPEEKTSHIGARSNAEAGNESDSFLSSGAIVPAQGALGESAMEQSLIIDLIYRTKGVLSIIEKLTQMSRSKFEDRKFGEFFYREVTKDIQTHNALLNAFLKYVDSTTPIPKKGTVNKLIEDTARKNQARLEEKRARVMRNLGEDLPETSVPDEQLGFILESLLQCALALTPLGGLIEFITRSVVLPGPPIRDKEPFERSGKNIEIRIAFPKVKKSMEQTPKEMDVPSHQEEGLFDLVYKLVEVIVKRNQGTIELKADERESKNTICLKLPVERRKTVYYKQKGLE